MAFQNQEERADREARAFDLAVAGLGYWGPNRLRVLVDMPDVRVRSLCDLDDDRLARYERRYPSTTGHHDFDAVLADANLDAVVIATPVFTHALAGLAGAARPASTCSSRSRSPRPAARPSTWSASPTSATAC